FTPLVPLILTGQEHTLHLLLTLLFFAGAARLLSRPTAGPPVRGLLILAPLLAMARYEGLFLIGVVALLLAVRRERLYAALLLLMGCLPVLVYGLFSVRHGW